MTTHMIQMNPDAARVSRWAATRGFLRGSDIGYGLHALLGDAFGEDAPKVFSWLDGYKGHRKPHLLAYSTKPADKLRERALTFAEPATVEALGIEGIASKAMPKLGAGTVVGVEVLTKPVVRRGRMVDGDRKTYETDAYLHARLKAHEDGRNPDEVVRDDVYCDWLGGRLAEQGVDVRKMAVTARRQVSVLRRARPSGGDVTFLHEVAGQDVRFDGTIEIVDADAFDAALVRGIGRHRAFGYGMLILRPPGSAALAA